MTDATTAYAAAVLAGEIPAGPFVHGACSRHVSELSRQTTDEFPYWFDPNPLELFRSFCGILRQYEGEWYGQPLTLMPWQDFIIGSILGWKNLDGSRRFNVAYVEIPRKNGKSAMLSALTLYMFVLDGEAGGQCYCLATKEDQAKIVYRSALKFFPSALQERYFKVRFKHAESVRGDHGILKPLGADSKTLDGLNPHFACADEVHAWKDRNLWDVVVSGMGARKQPLMFGITTGGFSKHGIGYELRDTGILLAEDAGKGGVRLDSRFAYIAAPTKADEKLWRDERVWFIANPALGSVKSLDYMRRQAADVEARPSQKTEFLAKHLNVWSDGATSMVDMAIYDALTLPADEMLMACAGRPCFGGLDLSSNDDLTAFSLYFPPEDGGIGLLGRHLFLTWQWIPIEQLAKKQATGIDYRGWVESGWVRTTPGNATDYRIVRADIVDHCKAFDVGPVAYDAMFASETAQALMEEGFDMVKHGQTYVAMHPPTFEFERLLARREIGVSDSPILRWQWGNLQVARSAEGLVRPIKAKGGAANTRHAKIDGPVSQLMALGAKLHGEPVSAGDDVFG